MATERADDPTGEPPIFSPARPRRVFDEIVDQIQQRIADGTIVPGDRLPSERALAAQFEVSRNTVREAMRMLEISGLVTMRKGATGGAFIREATSENVSRTVSDNLRLTDFSLRDLADMWLWMDAVVIRAVCERVTPTDLEGLDELIRATEGAAAVDGRRSHTTHHLRFQEALAECTYNPLLAAVMRSVITMVRDLLVSIDRPVDDAVMLDYRRTLMTHLRARDADAAIAATEAFSERLYEVWLGAEAP